jgi:hypothetical protein
MKERVDSSDWVKIRHNGMSQWDHQIVTDNQDSAIDSKVDARGMSANLSGTWKGDPILNDPADETKGQGPIGIAGAGSKGADKGTSTEVMDIDGGQVVLLEAMGRQRVKLSTDARNPEERLTGPLSVLTNSVKNHTRVL